MSAHAPAPKRRGLSPWQWLMIFALVAAMAVLALRYVRIGINVSGSLQARAFLVLRDVMPDAKGQYIVFRWSGAGGYYRPGAHFTKIVRGLPGDRIEVAADGIVTVAGYLIGRAKHHDSKGRPLEPIEPGVIPPGYFFVAGQSGDSLDSRYRVVGLIPHEHVIGTAYAIF